MLSTHSSLLYVRYLKAVPPHLSNGAASLLDQFVVDDLFQLAQHLRVHDRLKEREHQLSY